MRRDLAGAETGGGAKRSNKVRAIDAWSRLGARWAFEAGGVITLLPQHRERWHSRLDAIAGAAGCMKAEQWIADRIEAEVFAEVHDAACTMFSDSTARPASDCR